MSMALSFTNHYLLATVTSSIPAGGDFLPRLKEDMDLLMKNKLLPVGRDGALAGGRQVLWEEGMKGRKSSILDALIPGLDLTTKDILGIRYIKKKGEVLLQGASLLQNLQTGLEWRLDGAFSGPVKKLRRQWELETETDLEEIDEDSMMDTDASWSQQSFNAAAGQKRPNLPVKSLEEKSWERLLRSIYYAMCNIIREASDESSQSDSPNPLPFNVVPEPRYWSSEFATTPIPDATDSRKPDFSPHGLQAEKESISIANLQLRTHYMDRSGMIISQPVPIGSSAMRFVDVLNTITLSDLASLGFDPTVHICTDLCSTGSHNDLPEGIDPMPEGTKGWVMDNDSEVYWIMNILWKSRGLFSHGTVCYRVQDQHGTEFALKDCWVDAENLNYEVTLLQAVDGIPNVVSLKKYWDVQYAGQSDCTARIREHISEYLPEAPIYSNKSLPELVSVFRDLIVAHEAMVTQRNILHGDLSPNNIIIHDGKGYFIDFDHAKFLKNNAAVDSCGTGTVPYISCHLLKLIGDVPRPSVIDHRASDDLESLFYILLEFTTTYEGPNGKASAEGVHPVNAPRWRKAYLTMETGLEKILSFPGTPTSLSVAFLPVPSIATSPPTSPPTSLPLPARPHHPTFLPPASLPPPPIEAMTQDTGVRPHHSGWKMQMLPPELPSMPSVTRGAISSSASGSMASPFHSSSPPPTSGPMIKETRLRPRRSGQKNKMIPPPLPSLPSVGPNELPVSGAGSMTEELPSKPRRSK
ncbi:uncharacterized protein HD556DRAFT_1451679 [Suillus plorans]|uniref:Protein kinase domain-containing protein n=1 Tax=Suillus plorans TaxID=116603 RepID=A0A9P7A8Y1_9AGAM|nr:uncharacterized protein HD556DRAFT_1451679 [Suillus plorans]KAG1784521.1 hypothetical protein HD556DRAFT_1451679 [Suillus plorans]